MLCLTHCATSRKAYRTRTVVVAANIVLRKRKRTIEYGSARTGDNLIVGIKKSQHVPFFGQHYCHLKTAGTN